MTRVTLDFDLDLEEMVGPAWKETIKSMSSRDIEELMYRIRQDLLHNILVDIAETHLEEMVDQKVIIYKTKEGDQS